MRRITIGNSCLTQVRDAFSIAVLVFGVLLMPGCTSLPSAGPTRSEVTDQFTSDKNPLGARLINLDPSIVGRLQPPRERSLSATFGPRSTRATGLLGPGDVLSVSIYEAGSGLFAPRRAGDSDSALGSSAERLPPLQVDRRGIIDVPYAGSLRVAGNTTEGVARLIEARLAEKAAQPQVLVTLTSNESNMVYVSGDVKAPGAYPLSLAQLHLLDIIAIAGGPTHSAQDTVVRLTRGNRTGETSLRRIQSASADNVALAPLDRIQVDYLPRSYVAMGATGKAAEIPFDSPNVSLAEALARTGGLDDQRANPEAVFIFRFETPANLDAITQRAGGIARPIDARAPGAPVVYQVNMRNPDSFFVMQQFRINDKDVIYVANAPTVQIYKFLQLIYTFTTPAFTAKALSN